jgi:hypothetical protein
MGRPMLRLKRNVILVMAISVGVGIGGILGIGARNRPDVKRREIFEAGMKELCAQLPGCSDPDAVRRDLEKRNPALDLSDRCVVLRCALPPGSEDIRRVQVCQDDDGVWNPTYLDLGSN